MRDKTFHLDSPRQLLAKLFWEIQELDHTPVYDTDARVFRTLNCATAVWSLVDWIFESMTAAHRAQLSAEWGKAVESLTDFQTYMRENCRDIHRCRQLATGAKHGAVIKHTQ